MSPTIASTIDASSWWRGGARGSTEEALGFGAAGGPGVVVGVDEFEVADVWEFGQPDLVTGLRGSIPVPSALFDRDLAVPGAVDQRHRHLEGQLAAHTAR